MALSMMEASYNNSIEKISILTYVLSIEKENTKRMYFNEEEHKQVWERDIQPMLGVAFLYYSTTKCHD